MTRKEIILAEAKKHINGGKFSIKAKMLDLENDGNETNVTCLTFTNRKGKQRFIAIDLIWW